MNQKTPQHVAIVMDGNGRWAESKGLLRVEGHRVGAEVVRVIVQECLHKKIGILSLFAFGCENWSRPSEEVEFLMDLFLQSLEREIARLHDNGVCVKFLGDRTRLSPSLCKQMKAAETLTEKNKQLILNIAVSYSGRWDIVQAAKALLSRGLAGELLETDLDETVFMNALCTRDLTEPDLFIRTSGEQRISNFFLWQLAYSELYFTDVKWPDFNEVEFERALAFFSSRERRFGLTTKQLSEKN